MFAESASLNDGTESAAGRAEGEERVVRKAVEDWKEDVWRDGKQGGRHLDGSCIRLSRKTIESRVSHWDRKKSLSAHGCIDSGYADRKRSERTTTLLTAEMKVVLANSENCLLGKVRRKQLWSKFGRRSPGKLPRGAANKRRITLPASSSLEMVV